LIACTITSLSDLHKSDLWWLPIRKILQLHFFKMLRRDQVSICEEKKIVSINLGGVYPSIHARKRRGYSESNACVASFAALDVGDHVCVVYDIVFHFTWW
jgi:hypothetical protein